MTKLEKNISEQARDKTDGDLDRRFSRGNCTATIFKNKVNKDGKQIIIRNTVVRKSYKDVEGVWQSTSAFNVNDLPCLALVANEAYNYLKTKEMVRANG